MMMKTKRLSFRYFDANDIDMVLSLVSEPSVAEAAGFKAITTKEEAETFLQGLMESQALAVCLGDDVIGYFRVYPEKMDTEPYQSKDCVGLGFALRKDMQKKGYGTEMLSFLSDELKKAHDYVFADAFLDNEASNALIKKCGFHYLEDYSMYFDFLEKEMTCHSYVK